MNTVITIIIGVFFSFWILFLVRRNLLYLSYSIFWLFIAAVIFILGLFPGLNIILAQRLGIRYYPILPVVVAILILFVKLLKQDLELTEKKKMLKRLAQEIAILKANTAEKKSRENGS